MAVLFEAGGGFQHSGENIGTAPWGTGLKRRFLRGLLRQPTGDNMELGFCNHLLQLPAVETLEVLILH